MQLGCWSGSSHLHLWRQNTNCSSHIVSIFTDVLFGVIHTNTLLENLLSVIVTHTNDLFMSPDTPARAWPPSTVLFLTLSIVMHISSLH